jgi:Gluconate 2-dehydrogenase subunit 3
MATTRRTFLAGSAATSALGLSRAGEGAPIAPAAAAAPVRAVPYRVLNVTQAATLDAFGDVLLPGAQQAGLSFYIDHQLARPAQEQALMIRYLGLLPPFTDFYTKGIVALDALAGTRHSLTFAALPATLATDFVAAVAQGSATPWNGPPAALFYFVLRNDALDVVYGTEAGFAKLGIPYMAHISPPTRWPE